ncbi:MAG: HPr family phosphocarrier protein [Pseudomonadales bacterium]
MQQTTLTIVNPLGLHARAASKLVALAKTFESEIVLEKDGQRADGKSIMKVMLLAAPVGSEVALQVAGTDEDAAFDAVRALIDDGFGELG